MRAMVEIVIAKSGKSGYSGTLNGRSILGSSLLSLNNDTIDIIYSVSAPKQAIVIISAVLPDKIATIPINALTNKAFAGVLYLG